MHNGLPRWPYFPNRSKCMVSSKDMTTSRKSQQQTWPQQRRPLSKTGWIGMVLPDRLSYSAWNRGYKRNIRSSTLQRRFGKSQHQPTSQSWCSTSSRLGKTFGASSYTTAVMSTITHCGSITKSSITISAQSQRPLTPTLPTLIRMQRQSPRWVSRSTFSTSFAGSQGTTTGKSSWSSWWTKTP